MKNGTIQDKAKEFQWYLKSAKDWTRLKVIHGNLMIIEIYNSKIRLRDLRLCRLANEISSSGAYGELPYIVLNKYQHTTASDICRKISFAIIACDSELATDI
ncbi:hypothetical protein Glove_120g57 [Diversispora epigaea]|uniref:Protein kinase domain-containing protein n=1 Tax=Diversispora epigaea TaxID=1348612 RepID=A0A397J2D3_9GLOM|nr:hypothetical protein Glove_120g57 [Diversispora epigaea]